MPSRPPKACAVPGCPGLATDGARCPEHRRPAWTGVRSQASADRKKRIYDTRRWAGLRRTVLRQRTFCETPGCGRPSTEVDHIVAVEDGGPDFPPLEGLAALCRSCHAKKSLQERRARRQGGL
jgi:5-methylcytosine-specific restriction enzyme A